MSFSYGKAFRVTLFGQSHADAVGVVIDGLSAGVKLDMEKIGRFMARRAPGGALTTARKESDEPEIVSGVVDGYSCGAPITTLMYNRDTRSKDYSAFLDTPRPSHADYAAIQKYGAHHDIRGGGYFSARLTAPLCFAGALALSELEQRGIAIGAHLASVGNAADARFDPVSVCRDDFARIAKNELPVLEKGVISLMRDEVERARKDGDSVGGVVECAAIGLKAGLGEPPFEGIENCLSQILFAIPALRGVEFGAGFEAARMRGSEHNDAFCMEKGEVKTRSNRHGGVLGGLTSGMPLLFRAAFKPTPSIAKEQDTVSLEKGENAKLKITGRHDPCVVLRAVPCVEAAAAIALFDLLLREER